MIKINRLKFKNKKISRYAVFIFILLFFGYFAKGAFDYKEWIKTKEVVATGGIPIQCAIISTTKITPCARSATPPYSCSCPLCEPTECVVGESLIEFVAQPSANCPLNYFCMSPNFVNYKGGPPRVGSQAIVGATSFFMENGVYASPTIAANHFEKTKNFFDKYFIAAFKKEKE